MQKWEYKMLVLKLNAAYSWEWDDTGKALDKNSQDQRLNELGRDGWELVNVLSYSFSDGSTAAFHLYLKRPLE